MTYLTLAPYLVGKILDLWGPQGEEKTTDRVVNLGELTGAAARRALGAGSPTSDDSGAYSAERESVVSSYHSARGSSVPSDYSDASSYTSDHSVDEAPNEEEARAKADALFGDDVPAVDEAPNEEGPHADDVQVVSISENLEVGTDFFNKLGEIHANPYAFRVTKEGRIEEVKTFLGKLTSLVNRVVDKFFGVNRFADLTNAFLAIHADREAALKNSFSTSETAKDYELLAKISRTPGRIQEMAGAIVAKALPSLLEEDVLKEQVISHATQIENTKAYIAEKKGAIDAFSEEKRFTREGTKELEILEKELLEAIESLQDQEKNYQEFKEQFAAIRDCDVPHSRAQSFRYYQDRVMRGGVQFTVNGNCDDLAGMWDFVVNKLDNDGAWIKPLELILTQEAYMGFSHLPMVAREEMGLNVAFGKQCAVTMEKEGNEVVVKTAFPVLVKKDASLPQGITLSAKKEYRFSKEEEQVQLVAYSIELV